MKLGTRARYSVRMALAVGRAQGNGKPVPIGTIAKLTGISRGYLEQLTVALKNAGLLRGHAGRGGGYTLARPAGDISIGNVIEAAIGPIAIVDCVGDPTLCGQSDFCECIHLWQEANQALLAVFEGHTLADLLTRTQ